MAAIMRARREPPHQSVLYFHEASDVSSMSDTEDSRSLFALAVESAFFPFQVATSKSAQRAYLGTFLFAATTLILLCTSTVAYTLFYYNYIPQVGVEQIIHLQFGNGHPYGVASLSSSLTSAQAYDISLTLNLPRSPGNIATGNFMIDLALLSPKSPPSAEITASAFPAINASAAVLARSRRPATLTYTSAVVDTLHKLGGLPWYAFGWKKESEVLEISMFEGVEFLRGWKNVPDKVYVVVEADEKMQFYDVVVKVVARFGGLRYILYNYRILSFLVFTTAFFIVSIFSATVAYLIITAYTASPPPPLKTESLKIKPEAENSDEEPFNPLSTSDLSDTSRHFPTLGRQRPLYFSRNNEAMKQEEAGRIKQEDLEQEEAMGLAPTAAEADDEDEEDMEASWRDSGIGTSLDDGERRKVQRRRKGGG